MAMIVSMLHMQYHHSYKFKDHSSDLQPFFIFLHQIGTQYLQDESYSSVQICPFIHSLQDKVDKYIKSDFAPSNHTSFFNLEAQNFIFWHLGCFLLGCFNQSHLFWICVQFVFIGSLCCFIDKSHFHIDRFRILVFFSNLIRAKKFLKNKGKKTLVSSI